MTYAQGWESCRGHTLCSTHPLVAHNHLAMSNAYATIFAASLQTHLRSVFSHMCIHAQGEISSWDEVSGEMGFQFSQVDIKLLGNKVHVVMELHLPLLARFWSYGCESTETPFFCMCRYGRCGPSPSLRHIPISS